MIGFSIYSPKVTPLRVFEVIEVRVVQVIPSVDVMIVPLAPTVTKLPVSYTHLTLTTKRIV